MQIARTLREFNLIRNKLAVNKKLGFVPTMGNLHQGHLELMRTAKKHSDIVVASIFVNPAQFAANEDFDKYPRTMESDFEKMRQLGVDLVLAPENVSEVYPEQYLTRVFMSKAATEMSSKTHPLRNGSVGEFPNWLEDQPEALCRPGFFDGVSTILVKLFNIVRPQVVVMGTKDAVQCMVVKQLVRDLNYIDIEKVITGKTEREFDGLAMSSRNQYLTPVDRKFVAPVLNQSLLRAEANFEKIDGTLTNDNLKIWLEKSYDDLLQSFDKALQEQYSKTLSSMDETKYKIDYLSICNWETGHVYGTITTNKVYSCNPLFKIETEQVGDLCLSATIRVGGTRLLDNIIIKRSDNNIH